MGCNCKDAKKMRKVFGEKPANENVIDKLVRYIKNLFIIIITLILSVICIPIVFVVVMYNFVFNGRAYFNMSEKFIKRVLGVNNGEEVQS